MGSIRRRAPTVSRIASLPASAGGLRGAWVVTARSRRNPMEDDVTKRSTKPAATKVEQPSKQPTPAPAKSQPKQPSAAKPTQATKQKPVRKAAKAGASSPSKQDRVVAMLRTEGRHDRRGRHEGDRLAEAFGARLLCRRGAQEARPQPRVGEERTTSASTASSRASAPRPPRRAASGRRDARRRRSQDRSRGRSASIHADRRASRALAREVQVRSAQGVRTRSAAPEHRLSESRRTPMAGSIPPPSGCSSS